MRILHAIHDFLPRHRAGSEIYAHGLARTQRARGHEVHVVCAEYDPSRPHGSLSWREVDEVPVTEIVNNWVVGRLEEAWEPVLVEERLDDVLGAVAPDVLHLHNLLNLSLGLPERARARGIPVVATLHDFTLVCPSGGQRVHRSERHVCVDIDPDRCSRCFPESHFHRQMVFSRWGGRSTGLALAARVGRTVRRLLPRTFDTLGRSASRAGLGPAVTAADIERRLARVREVAAAVDRFVAPSETLAQDHARFGLPADRIEVSDYGFPPLEGVPGPVASGTGPLRIGFVGTLAWHKGVHVLLEAARLLAGLDGWEVAIHGSLETFPDYTVRLRELAEGLPVRFEGGFERGRVGSVYGGLDVLVVPSIWPENSPLVIHEAFQAGRPVVGARSGGIPGLVGEDGRGGWLTAPADAPALAETLRGLVEDPARVRAKAAHLPAVKSLARDAEEWEERYRAVRARRGGA